MDYREVLGWIIAGYTTGPEGVNFKVHTLSGYSLVSVIHGQCPWINIWILVTLQADHAIYGESSLVVIIGTTWTLTHPCPFYIDSAFVLTLLPNINVASPWLVTTKHEYVYIPLLQIVVVDTEWQEIGQVVANDLDLALLCT